MNEKILGLLGIAARARKLILGEELVLKAIAINPHNLVFLASDSGDNIKGKIINKTKSYNAILIDSFTTDELSKAVGKQNRKVVLVTDKGFIDKIIEYMNS